MSIIVRPLSDLLLFLPINALQKTSFRKAKGLEVVHRFTKAGRGRAGREQNILHEAANHVIIARGGKGRGSAKCDFVLPI